MILLILMVFHSFTPTELYPTKESVLDNAIVQVDYNINSKISVFADMNFGTDNNMLGKSLMYFGQAIKDDFYSAVYFAGAVDYYYPWIIENWLLIFIVIILFTMSDALGIILVCILGVILIIKERIFKPKERKEYGVWKNA
jgi:hypothetical protein